MIQPLMLEECPVSRPQSFGRTNAPRRPANRVKLRESAGNVAKPAAPGPASLSALACARCMALTVADERAARLQRRCAGFICNPGVV
jgi:hypothetical protein